MLDIISCGAIVLDLHSPDESLNIASFERFFAVIAAMLENMAKEKGLSYYDDMDKLVAEFNQNTIFLVLQVTENDIHMHRIYKTDSKQLF
jgi:hypothetical protein